MRTARKQPNPRSKTARPWLPSILVDLADVISIDLEDGQQLKFPRSGRYALCSNKSGREIWILSRSGSKNVVASDDKAEKLFEKFTGFEHDGRATMVSVPGRKMERIGRAINIVYRSDKFARPGKTSDYIHPFDSYPVVSVDSKANPKIVALRGGKIRIKQEGITG